MRDPLIDEARRAARLFDRPEARLQASAMAKQLGGLSLDAPQSELELREAIRCLMMALPQSPTGTHGLTAAAITAATRALALSLRLRGVNIAVEADAPVAVPDEAASLAIAAKAGLRVAAAPRPEPSVPYYLEKD